MNNVQRNPDVMWREEQDALSRAQGGLEQGTDIEGIGTAVLFAGGAVLSLNLVGMEIWKLCDGRSSDDIVTALLEQFDVDVDHLRSDVTSFLSELKDKGFISYDT
jgi:GeoRSP system PqqD family protein